MSTDRYRELGAGYALQRRADPRIQAHNDRALDGCSTVVERPGETVT